MMPLARLVQLRRGGRQHLTRPVRCELEVGDVRNLGHPLATPAGDVGNEHLLDDVQLGLVQDHPPSGATSPSPESTVEIRAERRGRQSVARGGPGARHELPVDDLRNQVLGDLQEVLVGRGTLRATAGHRILYYQLLRLPADRAAAPEGEQSLRRVEWG